MKVIVISDSHIVKLPDNTYWSRLTMFGYEFWKRYLSVFDDVVVVSRVKNKHDLDREEYVRADGPHVEIKELPFIRGAKEYVKNVYQMKKAIRDVFESSDDDCAIFRLPSIPAFMMLREYKKSKKPYGFEIIADPMDAYKENKIAQKIFTRRLKKECKQANGVSYVTQFFLQKRYPSYSIINGTDKNHFDTYYSSIDLREDFFYKEKEYPLKMSSVKLIHIANAINSDIKGHTTLLNIVKILSDKNIDVSLTCVGDGDRRKYYEDMAAGLGISDKVKFTGLISSKEALRDLLIESDLFVFPTKAEGLPRAVIEAMAVGLPCISTGVNGIPELISDKYLFEPLEAEAMAGKIEKLINNSSELSEMSKANIMKAKEYINTKLNVRREEYYKTLKNMCIDK